MKAYKLTDENCMTKNNTLWDINVTHKVENDYNGDLCSNCWIHFYTDPLIAVLINPIHANFKNPILWECETSGLKKHESLKSGCKCLTTIKQIPLPNITLNQKVAFGILCSLEVYKESKFVKWANDWLSRKDRSKNATYAAAYAAAKAAKAAKAANATYAAAYAAAYAADAAAYAAAKAADAAAYTNSNINFPKLAKKALTYN